MRPWARLVCAFLAVAGLLISVAPVPAQAQDRWERERYWRRHHRHYPPPPPPRPYVVAPPPPVYYPQPVPAPSLNFIIPLHIR